jgi:hypothetical protein
MAVYEITGWSSATCPCSCVSRRTYPPPQCIHSHEDDLVKDPLWPIIAFEQAESQLFIFNLFKSGQTRQEGFVRKEACCEDEYRDGYDYVGKGKSDALGRRDRHFFWLHYGLVLYSVIHCRPVAPRNSSQLILSIDLSFPTFLIQFVTRFSVRACGESSIFLRTHPVLDFGRQPVHTSFISI